MVQWQIEARIWSIVYSTFIEYRQTGTQTLQCPRVEFNTQSDSFIRFPVLVWNAVMFHVCERAFEYMHRRDTVQKTWDFSLNLTSVLQICMLHSNSKLQRQMWLLKPSKTVVWALSTQPTNYIQSNNLFNVISPELLKYLETASLTSS